MTKSSSPVISIVIPVLNEAAGLETLHRRLKETLAKITGYTFHILYVEDGSKDTTAQILESFAKSDPHVSVLAMSRNFGKEYSLFAGLTYADGDAIISLDGDGQHPVELIEKFIQAWEKGAEVVVGVKDVKQSHYSLRSRLFYAVFNKLSGQHLMLGATDYRLIDRQVQQAFIGMQENGRITRGLIDWLGFETATITFTPKKRQFGVPSYSTRHLIRLAVHSFVSLSDLPLYVFGALGVIITSLSGLLGLSVLIEQLILGDPLSWNFTGTAMLGVLILFLIGIVLMSQGILSLYISSIHQESKRRPLYVVNHRKSHNIKGDKGGN